MMRMLPPLMVLLLISGCRSDDRVVETEDGWLQRGPAEARDTTHMSVRLEDRTLVLDLDAGSVTIDVTDRPEAQLRFTRIARGRTETAARDLLGRLRIEESTGTEAHRVRAPVDRPGTAEMHLHAMVPVDAAVQIRLIRGPVRVQGHAGPLDVEVRNGNVRAAALGGRSVRIVTGRGHQNVGIYYIPRDADIHLEAASGDLNVILPPAGNADIVAATGVGSIGVRDLELTQRRFEERRTDSRFRARLGDGGATLRLETDLGDITLQGGVSAEMPRDVALDELPPDTLQAPAGPDE